MKARVGIFGGTFNPPHIGHIAAAKAFADEVKLDSLIIIPAFIPPHKEYDSDVSCADRLSMCEIAFKDIPNATVSDLEIVRGGKSYTYLTLQELSADDRELFFLCGTDMILTMDTWKNPEVIFSLATICYIRRENDDDTTVLIDKKLNEYATKYGARVIPIESQVIEISSSEVRGDVMDNSSYLTDGVMEYIRKAGLYV